MSAPTSQDRVYHQAGNSGEATPDRASFAELAATRRVVPVTKRLLADGETPIGVYRKLAGGPGTFLLESAEPGRSWSRYSFVGVRSSAVLTERDGRAVWLGEPPAALAIHEQTDVAAVLRSAIEQLSAAPLPGLPPLTSGLVGYLSYDTVRRFEDLPHPPPDDIGIPEVAFMLAADMAVLDHHDGSLLLIANAILPENPDESTIYAAHSHALGRLEMMTAALSRPSAPIVSTMDQTTNVQPDESVIAQTSRTQYQKSVVQAKEAIKAGECFQIVLSQRFERTTSADPIDVYRVLRATNPSPYMYLLRFDEFDIVGSSPEAHLKVEGGTALLRPIAGTRPRSGDPLEDERLASELMADPKERAEHVMLVDLARNDLGRVCEAGAVEVANFMSVERYSHVMHIVSTVEGRLRKELSLWDAVAATFPAGTLSGAPKVRAMQIIDELEPTRRGLYGGTVGYIGFTGDLDMAIAIRTTLMRDGHAYVQAGAGIVADSDPESEDQECHNKAAAVLNAIATAETLRPAR